MPESLIIQHVAATAAGVVVGLTTFCCAVGGIVFLGKFVKWVLTTLTE
jgi:hypothetical protein